MRVEVLGRVPLRFTDPFGDGDDRHVHVRAASSIVGFGDGFLLAQDDSNFAASWSGGTITPLRLFVNSHGDTFGGTRSNKRHKPDLECGFEAELDGHPAAVFLGSGSTDRRHRAAIVFEGTHEVRVVDLEPLYRSLIDALGVTPELLNIEGATRVGDRLVFAQRGNGGPGGVNALVSTPWTDVERMLGGASVALRADVRRFELGELDGARLGFTSLDVLADGTLLFAAAAESSPNTYDDGACTGSVLGLSDGVNVVDTARIGDGTDKVEGVVVVREDGRVIEALAVVDADDPDRPAEALQLRIER